jgi:hypothetical protein
MIARVLGVLGVFGALVSCSKGSPPVETAAAAYDAAPAPTPDEPAPGPALIAKASDARAAVGSEVRIEGTARDAKLSAVVMTGDLIVYCLDVDAWPDERSNETVAVRGLLEHTDEFSAAKDGPVSAGTTGSIYVIRTCTVE